MPKKSLTKKRARYVGELFCACWLDYALNLLADIKKPAREQAFAILALSTGKLAKAFEELITGFKVTIDRY